MTILEGDCGPKFIVRGDADAEDVVMDADQVVERLCSLQSKVAERVGHEYAADCFCRKGGFWGGEGYGPTFEEGYRNDGKALEFIEQAVREKIARESTGENAQ